MADQVQEHEGSDDTRVARAVIKGVAFGFPAAVALLTLAIFVITDLDLADAFATAILPGILLGGFAGGFAGIATSMD